MLDNGNTFVCKSGRIRKLVFQIGTVINHDDLVILKIVGIPKFFYQKYHSQRFPRPLRMPDHATSLKWRFAGTQTLDHLSHCPVLLVTAYHLDQFAFFDFHESRKVFKDIKKNGFVEHAENQHFLPLFIWRNLNSPIFFGKDIFPVQKMVKFTVNGTKTRFGSMGDKIEQI